MYEPYDLFNPFSASHLLIYSTYNRAGQLPRGDQADPTAREGRRGWPSIRHRGTLVAQFWILTGCQQGTLHDVNLFSYHNTDHPSREASD
jgi:hypothetical protein